jgi:2-iminobutanoate/2-iminopropanoate deaminase
MSATQRTMSIQIVDPESSAGRPYVPGVVAAGDLIFVSGQIPMRNGRLVDESIEAQVEAALDNVESILRHAGATRTDIVRCGVYVTQLADLPQLNAAYERFFGGHLPARTTVGVMLPGYDVEIDCIAVLRNRLPLRAT